MSKEAMKLALEALKQIDEAMPFQVAKLAQSALQEALAEQKSGIKQVIELYDSPDQPSQQEPVAMRYDFDGYGWKYIDSGSGSDWQTRIKDAEPIYITPPQRTWVGLTDQEFQWIYDHGRTSAGMMELVEAKLKEKNT